MIERSVDGEPLLLHQTAGDPEHDYDPAWDYELDGPPAPALVTIARQAAVQVASVSGERFALYAANLHREDVLARYCDGTASYPIILLDFDAHAAACRHYNVPLDVAFRTTIGHELGHALQEREDRDSDEDDAEAYAARLEAKITG
jgi:hypothetical protein